MSDAPDPTATTRETAILRLVAAYLAVTAIPVARIGVTGGRASVAAVLHMVALAALIAVLRSREVPRAFAPWVPLLLWPALYAEVPLIIVGLGSTYHDGVVRAWEHSLFGGQPAQVLAAAIPNQVLSEALHLGYLS